MLRVATEWILLKNERLSGDRLNPTKNQSNNQTTKNSCFFPFGYDTLKLKGL